jgi:hypothetical protein
MKPSSLLHLLTHAFRHRLKVLVVSSPGIGKSALVELAAQAASADLVTMHPAVSDPTDFKGMPAIVTAGKRQLAEFLPFGNLRKLVEATTLTVCFIDDIGQAPHAVQAALMQLIHAREVDGQKISDHVVFVGATNDSSHMAGVSSILEPVKSRWDTIVELQADVDDWVAWALTPAASIPPELIAFIRFRPTLLNDFRPTRELANSPCPRTVAAVGKWLRTGVEDPTILAGAAGPGFAAELHAFLKVWRSLPDLDALIASPQTPTVPTDPSTLCAVASALAYRATPQNFAPILQYTSRLPAEYSVLLVRDATSRLPALCSTPAYTTWALKNQAIFAP